MGRYATYLVCCTLVVLFLTTTASGAGYAWTKGSYFYNGSSYGNPLPMVIDLEDTLSILPGTPGDPTKYFDTCYPATGNGPVVNYGTILWGETGFLCQGASIENHGLFVATADNIVTYSGGWGGRLWNLAGGTFRKSGGAGSTVLLWANWFPDDLIFTNAGTLDAQIGTIEYCGAATYFNDGTLFTGAGTHRIATPCMGARFSGGITIDPAAHVILSDGFAIADGGAALSGPLVWTGGQLQGPWTLNPASSIELQPSAVNKWMAGATVTNHGKLTAGDNLYLSGSTVNNENLFDFNGPYVVQYSGTGAGSALNNIASGTIRMSAAGTAKIHQAGYMGLVFQNYGTLDAKLAASTMEYSNSDSHFHSGTKFAGAGTHLVSSTSTFYDNVTVAPGTTLKLDAPSQNLTGTGAVLHGQADYKSGYLRGDWTVASDATLSALVGGGSFRSISGTSFTNNGTFNIASQVYLEGWCDARNHGLIDFTGGYNLTAGGTGSNLTNESDGIIRMSGTGTAAITWTGYGYLYFQNNGRVEVQSGELLLGGGVFDVNYGMIDVAPSARVILDRSPLNNLGTIRGGGTLQVATLANKAALEPGSSLGALALTGNYNQDVAGRLGIDVAGTAAGAFDVVQVAGSAALNGELHIRSINEYVPPVGTEFTILTCGSRGGTFNSVTGSGQYDVIYGTDNVKIKVVVPPVTADINGDNLVDVVDLLYIVYSFGTLLGDPGYDPDCDLNGDGAIDVVDLLILVYAWPD